MKMSFYAINIKYRVSEVIVVHSLTPGYYCAPPLTPKIFYTLKISFQSEGAANELLVSSFLVNISDDNYFP